MVVTMTRLSFLLLLFSSLLPPILTVDSPLPAPDSDGSPLPAPDSDGSDFIRTSCSVTLYPDVCFSSLSSFANSIHNDSNRLARIAISLTLSNTLHLASYLKKSYGRCVDYSLPRPEVGAPHHPSLGAILKDCFENLKDAVDEMRGSMKQMKQLVSSTGSDQSFRFQMSNVKTWLSAALTNEFTCMDGFEDFHGDESIKSDVCSRVDDAKKLTSNALALVNRYADIP